MNAGCFDPWRGLRQPTFGPLAGPVVSTVRRSGGHYTLYTLFGQHPPLVGLVEIGRHFRTGRALESVLQLQVGDHSGNPSRILLPAFFAKVRLGPSANSSSHPAKSAGSHPPSRPDAPLAEPVLGRRSRLDAPL